jgi:hypothetical protein
MSAAPRIVARVWCGALLALAWLAPAPVAGAPSGFDHYSTGFELIGQHELVPCEGCHVGGIFKGTPHDCASCHTAGARFGATAKPTNHILSSNDCSLCHTPFGWRPVAMFDHTHIMGTCASCHDNVQTKGKPSNHIPTTQDCSSCHLLSLPWAAANFTHAGVTGNCASCHDGVHAPGKPANHLPTTTACETCHTSRTFKTWTGTPMNHAGITRDCQSCHETGMSWFAVTMVDRPTSAQDPSHPTRAAAPDCAACHTGFAVGDFGSVSSKPPNHIPTSAPCARCHTTPNNYVRYVMGSTGHAGITSGCATCHAAGLTFLNMAPPALKEPPANHLPINGIACESCHSTASFAAFSGTAMSHAGITKNCQSCHETGMSWYGVTMVDRPTPAQDKLHPTAATGPDCSSCHSGFAVGDFNKNAKPANHVPTNAACAQCHTGIPNFAPYVMGAAGHSGITSGCATCHAGGLSFYNMAPPTLREPPANHLPISTACETCHSNANFTTFSGTTMNHAGISKNCQNCHETGMSWYAVTMVVRPTPGQDPTHPTAATGPDCSSCHSGFAAGDFNNVAVPKGHIPTTQTCSVCHNAIPTYASYVMGATGHTGITSGCANCHAAGLTFLNMVPPTLKEPPANHLPISTACESCHSNANFATFSGTTMNHAGITKNCQNCHETGMSWYGVTMVDRPTPGVDPNHPTVAQGATDCSSCHSGFAAGDFSNNIVKPATHIPTTQACNLCHTAIPNYASYVMGATGHTGITSGCATCHASGLTFSNMAPPTLREPPANHLPISTACETCHSNANFTTFSGTTMNHAGITKNCQSCHETGMSWYGVTMVDRPTPGVDPNHPTIAQGATDCSSCHSGFAVGDFSNNIVKPANHIPTTVSNCGQCHNAIPNYASYVMGATGHAGITSGCATCHAAGLSFSNMAPPTLKEPPANHLPINGTACETCHSNSNFVAFGPGTAMNHAGITKNCQNCHETGMSWYGVTMVDRPTPAQDMNHPTKAQGPDCSACHTGFAVGNFNNVTTKPANHIPTSANCSQCHTTPGNYAVYTGGATLHTGISSNCIQCHGTGKGPFAGAPGFTVKQPPANHIPTKTAACEGCHSITNFTTFSGTNIHHAAVPHASFACDSCHETGMKWFGVTMVDRPPGHNVGKDCYPCHQPSDAGGGQGFNLSAQPGPTAKFASHPKTAAAAAATVAAAGLPAGHPRTTGNCAACHGAATNSAGAPRVVRVDHMEVLGTCQSCHDAVHAPAKPARHPLSGANCDSCHTTSAWIPAVFDHSQVVSGTCFTCHNGLQAVARPAKHPATTLSCDSCHYVLAWTPQRPAAIRKQPVRPTITPPAPHTRTPAGPAAQP